MSAAPASARHVGPRSGPRPGPSAPSGQAPPHNLDAEGSVLGAMLLSASAIDEVSEILRPADFYRGTNRTVFETITGLHDAGEPADPITVGDELERRGQLADVGGAVALADLMSATPTTATAPYYARIVADCALRRRILDAASQIARLAMYPDNGDTAVEIADQAETLLHEHAARRTPGELSALRGLVTDQLARLEALEGQGPVTGLATGYPDLDRLTAGLQPASLVLLAARPGLGKSALAVNIATHAAVRLRQPVALFSLEMSAGEIVQRILSAECRLPLSRLRTGQLGDPDWAAISGAVGRLADAPLHLDDSPGLSASDVRARARRLQRRHGLALVVVDYLQLLAPPRRMDNHASELAETSRSLKLLAKELELPVLALSQLSRRPEERTDRRPQLADLRGSGGLEQDADLVWLLYREAAYQAQPPVTGAAELAVAKHRNGALGMVPLVFHAERAQFAPATTREAP
ncbi:MAG: replicative DNA helicase [Egibacteraceae bacterium]